jgi:hypothetical protein
MSAYALPGFFPPVESSFGSSSGHWTSYAPETKENYNLQYQYPSEACSLATTPTAARQSLSTASSRNRILIQDATIDTAVLIQSVLLNSQPSLSVNHPSCKHNYTARRRPRGSTFISADRHQEQAVHYHLLVTSTTSATITPSAYAIKKSLAAFAKLHHDLVKEQLNDAASAVGIPPLPQLDDQGLLHGAGVVGRGFSMLQELLRSHVPKLQEWLDEVDTLMSVDGDQSVVWKEFLASAPAEPEEEAPTSKLPATTRHLGPIEESETEYDDDGSEDDDTMS